MQELFEHPELPLEFDGALVVVGGGAVDIELLQNLHVLGLPIVAADGGASSCADANILPDAIIGDLDSIGDARDWEAKIGTFRLEEQQTTDFEKCVYATRSPLLVALGMTGKRFDHTLAALHVVTKYAGDRSIILVDEQDIALGIAGDFSFTVTPGARVSMHPLGTVKFASSQGLKYPLDNIILAPGILSGTSNEAEVGPFSVNVLDGEQAPWLLLVEGHYIYDLMKRCLHE